MKETGNMIVNEVTCFNNKPKFNPPVSEVMGDKQEKVAAYLNNRVDIVHSLGVHLPTRSQFLRAFSHGSTAPFAGETEGEGGASLCTAPSARQAEGELGLGLLELVGKHDGCHEQQHPTTVHAAKQESQLIIQLCCRYIRQAEFISLAAQVVPGII